MPPPQHPRWGRQRGCGEKDGDTQPGGNGEQLRSCRVLSCVRDLNEALEVRRRRGENRVKESGPGRGQREEGTLGSFTLSWSQGPPGTSDVSWCCSGVCLGQAGRVGMLISRFGRRRDRAHIWGNRKEEVVEAFTGMEVTQVNARCLLRGEIKKKKKRIKNTVRNRHCSSLAAGAVSEKGIVLHTLFPELYLYF